MSLTIRPAAVVISLAVLGLPVLSRLEGPPPPPPSETVESWSGLSLVRTLELDGIDFAGPTGLAWSEQLGALVATESTDGRQRATAFTGDENLLGRVRLPGGTGVDGVAVDPGSGQVTVLGDGQATAVSPSGLRGGAQAVSPTSLPALPDSDGATYDHDGELVLLSEGDLVRVGDDGDLDRTSIEVTASHELRGLTTHPETGELYTLDMTARELLALDAGGHVVTAYGAGEVDLIDVQDIAFGASGDPTDDPSVTRLFIADAGAPGATGVVHETALQQQGLAANYTVTSSQVRTVATSSYNPPSPDPSGIAYLSGADRLFMSDGEVDEMSIYRDVNLFQTTRAGAVQTTGDSLPWSAEPVGVGYNPGNNHLFISDDDEKSVTEIVAGGDGRFGTGDDTRTSWTVDNRGITDPEGIDFDPLTNSLWFSGGEAGDFHRQQAGTDGRLGTSDDVYTHWDGGAYGIQDPEGLGYDSARDTIAIVDDSSQRIYEFNKNGALLNTIDVSAANGDALAGLAVGPSTSGSGRSYYVVARGVDNNSDPNENDGRLYEIVNPLPAGGGGGPVNQAPVVDAGLDRSVTLPDSVTMAATVTDDGLPDPPGAVTRTWSVASGPPGNVTFSPSTSAEDPTVTFENAGTYVLRLTATDGAATTADEVTVQVAPVGGALSTEARVSIGSDDAEQSVATGSMELSSSDLELTTDGNTQQAVGVRFQNLQVPQGASIVNAYVQFRTDETSTGASSMTIRAENVDHAGTYTTGPSNVTNRATTGAVSWSPPDWSSVGEAGAAQRTPNLSALVQAVVGRPGWTQGNALALQFSGTGRRTAEAFEGGATLAPLLHVDFTTGSGGGTTNQPPVVSAGTDQTITLPATASLDGTVDDDGLPNPPGATTSTWSEVSGPGTVTFSPNASSTDVTATFSEPGTYVLQLTGSDSVLSAQDDVTITVNPATSSNAAPVVDAGADQEITLPSTATMAATVTDDGLPDPPGSVTLTWTMQSGPSGGSASFSSASAEDPVVTFSAAGTYVLQLGATDGSAGLSDTVTVVVNASGGGGTVQTFERRVAAGSDDAEQSVGSGSVNLSSSDLELTTDGSTQQVVGIRFQNVQVPKGASITDAYVQFRTDETSTGASSMTVRAENADNAPTYTTANANVTSRATTGSVAWSPPDWTTVGEAGAAQRTPNLSALVGAVVSRAGWASGNALALQLSGTGRRTAEAFEGGATLAPLLHVEYTAGGGGTTNVAPVVDAGADQEITLPSTATMAATVTDDGLPVPPGAVTRTWSQLSGPAGATASFSDTSAEDPVVTFPTAGDYVLRLEASDGALSHADTVTVTVNPAGGGGGTSVTFEKRVSAGSDDAEESTRSGKTALNSDDLEITTDGNTVQLIGVRFTGVTIPKGATITNAYVQFRVDGVSTAATNLTVRAEAADNTPTYTSGQTGVSLHPTTTQSVAWVPPPWSTVGAEGPDQRTPDLRTLVQAVVDRAGWVSGNALAFQVSGTGMRKAVAFEGGANLAPMLHVEYTVG